MQLQVLSYNTHGLPWSRDTSKEITKWLRTLKPSIICIQEAFTESARTYYKKQLELEGYNVYTPRDTGVAFLSSGLVTAILEKDYDILSDCFCSYQTMHYVEFFANKGFHVLRLYDKRTGKKVTIANTHMQSDTEIAWLYGKGITDKIRVAQFNQIYKFFENDKVPVFLIGDLNCEVSPHPYLRFLHPHQNLQLKKRTFYKTGEDLDHVAWFPLQWAKPNCMFCDIIRSGPQVDYCSIFEKPWSDHAPLLLNIRLPVLTTSSIPSNQKS